MTSVYASDVNSLNAAAEYTSAALDGGVEFISSELVARWDLGIIYM
jgi:hypothetical protein